MRGLNVPAENREHYGFDEDGRIERHIRGVPRSVAMRRAPEAIAAARELSEMGQEPSGRIPEGELYRAGNHVRPGALLNCRAKSI